MSNVQRRHSSPPTSSIHIANTSTPTSLTHNNDNSTARHQLGGSAPDEPSSSQPHPTANDDISAPIRKTSLKRRRSHDDDYDGDRDAPSPGSRTSQAEDDNPVRNVRPRKLPQKLTMAELLIECKNHTPDSDLRVIAWEDCEVPTPVEMVVEPVPPTSSDESELENIPLPLRATRRLHVQEHDWQDHWLAEPVRCWGPTCRGCERKGETWVHVFIYECHHCNSQACERCKQWIEDRNPLDLRCKPRRGTVF